VAAGWSSLCTIQEEPMFVNKMPRYDILSEDAIATLDVGWRRLMTEIGVEFLDDRALDLFRQHGQRVEDQKVFLDPDFVLEQVAKAPREFDVQARNPERSVHIGGDHMAFGAVYGPPFTREGDVRRDATMEDFRNFTKLSQSFDALDSAGGVINEPNDTPLDSRHLDMVYALATLTDKLFMGNVVSGVNARDTIEMASILFGDGRGREHGRARIEETPATISLINCNSPLRWDDRMLEAQFEYSAANQAVVLTPFILMGAMSPVTIPAALVQQITEALSGIALSQLIRPGSPVIFGSFLSNIDMQSGSPTFGTPESGIGLLCTGQIARHFGLPFRTGGGLTSSQVPDAQAGYEALMTMLPTFLAGTNWVMHSAGWLEGGLVAGYEKFIIDVQLVEMLQHEFTPLEIDEASMAFGAHEEVGHGGHFLGAMHTMERFRTCFYRPFLNSSDNYERWMRGGGLDTADRAGKIWRTTLEEYEQPAIDEAIRAELEEYVVRRRAELGD
jgi:trimethylamine--corrinoid protein Co-methyltransferase